MVDEVDRAVAALRLGAYEQADRILTVLGAGKQGTAPRARVLWAVTQVMVRNFDDAVDALADISAHNPNRSQSLYHRVEALVGGLDALLPAAAAQEVRLRVGDYFLLEEKAEDADDWMHAALAADPNDPLAIYVEANCPFARDGARQGLHDLHALVDPAADDL